MVTWSVEHGQIDIEIYLRASHHKSAGTSMQGKSTDMDPCRALDICDLSFVQLMLTCRELEASIMTRRMVR